MRPVIPATLAPQIRHFREISAIKDEWRLFNQIRKVYLCRGAKKAKGVSGLIVESVQGVAIGLFKIVDHRRNDRGGRERKFPWVMTSKEIKDCLKALMGLNIP